MVGTQATQHAETIPSYFNVTCLAGSRPTLQHPLEQTAQVLHKDTLPAINPAEMQKLAELRQAYIDSNAAQGGKQSDVTKRRRALEQMIQSITDRRVEIQHSADAEWPYSDEMNHLVRREFLRPLIQPCNG